MSKDNMKTVETLLEDIRTKNKPFKWKTGVEYFFEFDGDDIDTGCDILDSILFILQPKGFYSPECSAIFQKEDIIHSSREFKPRHYVHCEFKVTKITRGFLNDRWTCRHYTIHEIEYVKDSLKWDEDERK